MRVRAQTVGETLRKDHRVLERLADEFDRSRLRASSDLRRRLAAALEIVGPALAAHKAIETAALGASSAPRPPQWRETLLSAELQRDRIASLAKDMAILVSDPVRYRLEHLAALSFTLSKALRELLAFEAVQVWDACPELTEAAPVPALSALRRVEGMLGRL